MTNQSPNQPSPRVRISPSGGGQLTGEEARNTGTTVRRLFSYLGPYRWRLLVVATLVLVTTAAGLVGPILVGVAIDRYIIPGDVAGLARTVMLALGIYVAGGAAQMVQGVLMVEIAQRLMADIRAELFAHIQTLSMAYLIASGVLAYGVRVYVVDPHRYHEERALHPKCNRRLGCYHVGDGYSF